MELASGDQETAGQSLNFGASISTAPTYGLHMMATTGDAGSIHLTEVTTAPTTPAASAGVVMYMKADKLVFKFDDAGTVRYLSIPLSGTGTAWTHDTTAI